jgi:hypothetical protein
MRDQLLALVDQGNIVVVRRPTSPICTAHVLSYKRYGYSPTGLAWLAKKSGYGFQVCRLCVLDGVTDFSTPAISRGRARQRGDGDARLHPRVCRVDQFAGEPEFSTHGHRFYLNGFKDWIGSSVESVEKTEARTILASLRARAETRIATWRSAVTLTLIGDD